MKKLLILALLIFTAFAPVLAPTVAHAKCSKSKHRRASRPQISKMVVQDTIHIPVIVFDTERVPVRPMPEFVYDRKQLIANFVELHIQNFVSAPPRYALPASEPIPEAAKIPESGKLRESGKSSASQEPTPTTFQPFVEAGLHGEAHTAATWSAGLGLLVERGPVQLECAAMIEPAIPEPDPVTNAESAALEANKTAFAIRTVIYGALRFIL